VQGFDILKFPAQPLPDANGALFGGAFLLHRLGSLMVVPETGLGDFFVEGLQVLQLLIDVKDTP
jgi:hypothetical protein